MRKSQNATHFEITFSFFLAVALFLYVDRTGITWMILFSICLHEAAHIITMLMFHMPIEKITLSPFGVHLKRGMGVSLCYTKEALVYMAGPFINAVVCLVCVCIGSQNPSINMLFAINCILALFNLIPVLPLDGGQLLRTFLNALGNDFVSHQVSKWTAFLVLVPLLIFGGYLFVKDNNFTLLVTGAFLLFRTILSDFG